MLKRYNSIFKNPKSHVTSKTVGKGLDDTMVEIGDFYKEGNGLSIVGGSIKPSKPRYGPVAPVMSDVGNISKRPDFLINLPYGENERGFDSGVIDDLKRLKINVKKSVKEKPKNAKLIL